MSRAAHLNLPGQMSPPGRLSRPIGLGRAIGLDRQKQIDGKVDAGTQVHGWTMSVRQPVAPALVVTQPQPLALLMALVVAACLTTVAPSVWASDSEAQGSSAESADGEREVPPIDVKKLALQFLNFGVLVFIVVKFGGGAINRALAARHQQLKTDLASAAALRAAAETKLARQEARLGSLEQEIAGLRREIKAEAEAEKTRLIATAEERAERIKTETVFLVEQQVREAEVRLRRESADAALKAAEEILRRSIGSNDQERLINTFIDNLGEPALRQGGPV